MNQMKMTTIVHINKLQMKNNQMHQVSIYYLLKTVLIKTKNQKQNMHKKISKNTQI